MKSGLIEAPGVLRISERDMPGITSDDDVLIKVKLVGICGSDMHILHGKNPFASYPRVWGHEFTGEVASTGAAVKSVAPGDRVVVEPIRCCGECYACRKGRGNVCSSLRVMGVHVDGGCQEYVTVPAAHVYKLPDGTPWEIGVLVEPFTIGAQAALRGGIGEGDVVLVMGAGPIGLTALQMAKIGGAVVIVTDLVDEKLDYAVGSGADYALNAGRERVYDRVMEITDGMGANVVIDAVCTKSSFEEAVELASPAGRVVELGFGSAKSEIAPVTLTKNEITICGSRLQTNRFPVVIDLLRAGRLKLDGFITASYPLAEMDEAFRYAGEHAGEVRKVVVSME
jgi:L-gulonate 5-dehydrogenase